MSLESRIVGHFILKIQGNGHPLCRGSGNITAVVEGEVFPCIEQSKTEPGIHPFDKFSVDAGVQPIGIGSGFVIGIIADAYIVNFIGDDIFHFFIIPFHKQFEGPSPGIKLIISPGNEMVGALGFELLVEGAVQSPQFPVKRGLLIHTGSQPELEGAKAVAQDRGKDILHPGAEEQLFVEVPVIEAGAGYQHLLPAEFPGMLGIGQGTAAVELGGGVEALGNLKISGRICSLVFLQLVFHPLILASQTKMQGMAKPPVHKPGSLLLGTHHIGHEVIAAMIEISAHRPVKYSFIEFLRGGIGVHIT